MQDNYYSIQKFWTNDEVPTKTKLMIYRSLIVNAALDGLEPEVLTPLDYHRLEIQNRRYLKKSSDDCRVMKERTERGAGNPTGRSTLSPKLAPCRVSFATDD